MVFYKQYNPSESLVNIVECYWVFRMSSPVAKQRETLIPGGRIEWIFNFGSPLQWTVGEEKSVADSFPQSVIMGQRDRAYFARQTGETSLLGIRFKPGGFCAFSSFSAHSLLNRLVPAGPLLEFPISELEKNLRFTDKDADRIEILEQYLIQHMHGPSSQQKEARKMINSFRDCSEINSIEFYCSENNIHYKKLERVFLKYVGYTPKSYLRILRFNKALRQLNRKAHLTRLAYDSGYFDQSHFIKDFRVYTGMPPGIFDPVNHTLPQLLMDHQPV